MKRSTKLRLSACSIAITLAAAGSAFAQTQPVQSPAAAAFNARAAADKAKAVADNAKAALERALENAKNPIAKPNPVLAKPFDPQVGSKLIAVIDQMTAAVAAVTTPAQAAPAMAKIQQIWPSYIQWNKEFDAQLEQIAAADQAGKKTADMKSVETAMASTLATKGQALDAELLRLTKMPLAAPDMALVQNLRKALAE